MRDAIKIIIATALLLAAPFQGFAAEAGARRVITITDAFGKKVEILAPAQRIVTTNGQAAEIICALGAADQIAGISIHAVQNNVQLLSALKGKPSIGHSANPSLEKIIELQPDLVIAYDTWMTEEALEGKLNPLGIPVIRLRCYPINSLPREIPLLGKIVGREHQAAEYLQYFQNCLEEINQRLAGVGQRVRVYAEGYGNFVTSSNKAATGKLVAWAGVDNIAADQPVANPRITAEWIVEANPEVIVKAASPNFVKMGYGTHNIKAARDFRHDLLQRPGWDQVEAVKTGRVYLVASEIWNGPRAAVGALYLAKWCYPDRFQDIDPKMVHRQWLVRWHHKELKGIYVYP